MEIKFQPIGFVESPYQEKFAIPRQPGLVKQAIGYIHMETAYSDPNLFRGLLDYSHLWVQFLFHATQKQGWQPLVRPPRLGGNTKKGVFATRSPFRPNPIGLSVVQLEGMAFKQGRCTLTISGLDLLNNTPVLDIKPYINYADQVPNAHSSFAQPPSSPLPTQFHPEAEKVIQQYQKEYPHLKAFITEVLAQDPRPAYQTNQASERSYGVHLYCFDIKWQIKTNPEIRANCPLSLFNFVTHIEPITKQA